MLIKEYSVAVVVYTYSCNNPATKLAHNPAGQSELNVLYYNTDRLNLVEAANDFIAGNEHRRQVSQFKVVDAPR